MVVTAIHGTCRFANHPMRFMRFTEYVVLEVPTSNKSPHAEP